MVYFVRAVCTEIRSGVKAVIAAACAGVEYSDFPELYEIVGKPNGAAKHSLSDRRCQCKQNELPLIIGIDIPLSLRHILWNMRKNVKSTKRVSLLRICCILRRIRCYFNFFTQKRVQFQRNYAENSAKIILKIKKSQKIA